MVFGKKRLRESGAVCQGSVVRLTGWSQSKPAVIYVRYTVNGTDYQLRETMKVRHRAIRIGRIPIGQRVEFRMGNVRVGDMAAVCYDAARPSRACLRDNTGFWTN